VSVSRSVVPGDWYGVLGDDVAVLLPPAAKARVAGLWERVDEGAGFDEVLDVLISGGLRELPGFVLVSSDGPVVRVVIRGAGRAELTTSGGPVTVTGAPDTTWVEQSVTGVTGLRVHVADGAGASYPFDSGLVRVAGLEQSTAPDPSEPLPAAPVSAPAPEASSAPEPSPIPEPAPVPAPVPVAAPVPVQGPLPGADPPPVVTPDPGDTQSGTFDPGQLAPPPDGLPGTPQAPAVSQRPVARLIFSSGEIVDVDRAVLVGRSPESRRFGGDDRARLITVPSPHQEISSTHLEIRPGTGADHGSAVVTDLGSTNGSVVVQPGLPAEDLQPGIAVQLIPGAIVDLGEGVTIQVTTV
jgi:hypothetical protein